MRRELHIHLHHHFEGPLTMDANLSIQISSAASTVASLSTALDAANSTNVSLSTALIDATTNEDDADAVALSTAISASIVPASVSTAG